MADETDQKLVTKDVLDISSIAFTPSLWNEVLGMDSKTKAEHKVISEDLNSFRVHSNAVIEKRVGERWPETNPLSHEVFRNLYKFFLTRTTSLQEIEALVKGYGSNSMAIDKLSFLKFMRHEDMKAMTKTIKGNIGSALFHPTDFVIQFVECAGKSLDAESVMGCLRKFLENVQFLVPYGFMESFGAHMPYAGHAHHLWTEDAWFKRSLDACADRFAELNKKDHLAPIDVASADEPYLSPPSTSSSSSSSSPSPSATPSAPDPDVVEGGGAKATALKTDAKVLFNQIQDKYREIRDSMPNEDSFCVVELGETVEVLNAEKLQLYTRNGQFVGFHCDEKLMIPRYGKEFAAALRTKIDQLVVLQGRLHSLDRAFDNETETETETSLASYLLQ